MIERLSTFCHCEPLHEERYHIHCNRCGKRRRPMSAVADGLEDDASDKICPKDKRIYLASPYTHDDPDVMQTRYGLALYATSIITNAGYIIYSPIVYGHIIAARYSIYPTDSDWWVRFNRSFIENWATTLAILKLPGWHKSSGIEKEKAIAKNKKLQQIELTVENIYDISRTGVIKLDR